MFKIIAAILNLFDEGAAQGDASANNLDNTHQDSGDLSKVKYGKQPAAQSGTPDGNNKQTTDANAPDTTDDNKPAVNKDSAFTDLIRGEYKEQYANEVQKVINKRFAETKAMEDKISKQDPLIQSLIQRYGTDDLTKLQEAINADSDFLAEAAAREGMSVDQYKIMTQLKRENAVLKASQQQALSQQQAEAQLRKWAEEGEQLKVKLKEQLDIDFDINAEVANPDFANLLKSGVSVETAYNALHFNELGSISNAKAVKATEKAVVDQIRANGTRPVEAGTSTGGGFTYKPDVHKLTKEDRAEIARRAARGEEISF